MKIFSFFLVLWLPYSIQAYTEVIGTIQSITLLETNERIIIPSEKWLELVNNGKMEGWTTSSAQHYLYGMLPTTYVKKGVVYSESKANRVYSDMPSINTACVEVLNNESKLLVLDLKLVKEVALLESFTKLELPVTLSIIHIVIDIPTITKEETEKLILTLPKYFQTIPSSINIIYSISVSE